MRLLSLLLLLGLCCLWARLVSPVMITTAIITVVLIITITITIIAIICLPVTMILFLSAMAFPILTVYFYAGV
ncbi:hypothetical protein TURU_112196 [Turdus rufiventris]|nr:hypothetical protein TURU_112196 [Turdus rufiventris]